MNRAPLIFLGIFGALAFSWTGIVLTNHVGYGDATPHFDENEGKAFPLQIPGVAARGKFVYQDLGCVQCHTQQVRRAGFGADVPAAEGEPSRGWGVRGSVPRDYLREDRVLLGHSRIGPDLRNVGARLEAAGRDAAWLHAYLFDPRAHVEDSTMPPHPFLYETRPIVGQPSPKALALPAKHAAPAGHEIVPTERAEALVAYLFNLKDTYAYPETEYIYVPEPADAAGEQAEPAEAPASDAAANQGTES